MSVAVLVSPRCAGRGPVADNSARRKNPEMTTDLCGAAAAISPRAVNSHEGKTPCLSRTLFRVPSATKSVARGHHHPSPVLLTFPIDRNHLLVACGLDRNNAAGDSSVYVVRLNLGGPPTSVCNRLPIAAISGCVPDLNVRPSRRRETTATSVPPGRRDTAEVMGGDHAKEMANNLLPFSSSLPEASTMPVPTEKTDGSEEGDTVCGRGFSKLASSCLRNSVYPFLFADAVMHAIWAAEIDTETLTARVVHPSHYWRSRKDDGGERSVTSLRTEQVSRSRVLIGGTKGFVDGPFHTAKFASPSALCWRLDTAVNDDSGESPPKPRLKPGSSCCSVLFVSDAGNHAIRYVDFQSECVRTVSGMDGVPGYRDGDYSTSRLQEAAALVWCTSGLLFLDKPNGALRLITELETIGVPCASKKTTKEEDEEASKRGRVVRFDLSSPLRAESKTGQKRRGGSAGPRVWTVAGGLFQNTGPCLDTQEAYRSSLGAPSALALMPDGKGVLIADSRHQALRLLSSRGVETFFRPCEHPNNLPFPDGLMNCTHILACDLELSHATSRTGFLVSSGAQRAVSLLLPCSEAETLSEDKHVDMNSFSIVSLLPVECVHLEGDLLRKYVRCDGRETAPKRTATTHEEGCRRKTNTKGGDRNRQRSDQIAARTSHVISSVTARSSVSPSRVHHVWATAAGSGPLEEEEEATRRLFRVYEYYATKGTAPCTLNRTHRSKPRQAELNLNASYSLSLLSFWRFLTHTKYFAVCSLSSLSSSPCSVPAMMDKSPRITSGEEGDSTLWRPRDWRLVAEVLHGLSRRQHGYHVTSVMNFSFFCRVILFLHRWTRQLEAGGQREKPRGTTIFSVRVLLDGVREEDVVGAYRDVVRRVEATNLHLRRVMAAATEEETKEKTEEEEEKQFLAADEVLRMLVRNEGSLRQLFDAYSQAIAVRQSFLFAGGSKHGSELGRLRAVLLSANKADEPSGKHVPTNDILAMPYTMFRKLFHAVDVFPQLIGESQMQRAFLDAATTPLFRQQHRGKRHDAFFLLSPQSSAGRKCTQDRAALPFLLFTEAFVRVAITAFSLCPEHDERMYPTPAAKVDALMRWVNRSVEMGHAQRQPPIQDGGGRCGKCVRQTSAYFLSSLSSSSQHVMFAAQSPAAFPSDFIPFNVSDQLAEKHCKENVGNV